jgi:hypothetical protein
MSTLIDRQEPMIGLDVGSSIRHGVVPAALRVVGSISGLVVTTPATVAEALTARSTCEADTYTAPSD